MKEYDVIVVGSGSGMLVVQEAFSHNIIITGDIKEVITLRLDYSL